MSENWVSEIGWCPKLVGVRKLGVRNLVVSEIGLCPKIGWWSKIGCPKLVGVQNWVVSEIGWCPKLEGVRKLVGGRKLDDKKIG